MSGATNSLLVASIVFPLLSLFFVCLRFFAQKKGRLMWPLHADEFFILLAWLVCLGSGIMNIVGIEVGAIGSFVPQGKAPQGAADADPNAPGSGMGHGGSFIMSLKINFAQQLLYILSTTLVKISLLLFYIRIFSLPSFLLRARSLLVLTISWLIAFIILTIFQTTPPSHFWRTGNSQSYNFDINEMYLGAAISDMVLDICILCLPLPEIKKLRIPRRKKGTVYAMFGVGFFAVLAGSVRIYWYWFANSSFEHNGSALIYCSIWSLIESCWSVTCACLPTLGPLFKSRKVRALFSRSNTVVRNSTYKWGSSMQPTARRERIDSIDGAAEGWVNPMFGGIRVDERVSVTREVGDLEMGEGGGGNDGESFEMQKTGMRTVVVGCADAGSERCERTGSEAELVLERQGRERAEWEADSIEKIPVAEDGGRIVQR